MHREVVKHGQLESSLLHPEIQMHREAVKHIQKAHSMTVATKLSRHKNLATARQA
jgi:hypothetical protein